MLTNYIASNFKKPLGLGGIFAANVMAKGNKDKYERLLTDMALTTRRKVLEIGYGPGIGIDIMMTAHPDCLIDGVDFSPLMYKQAKKRNDAWIKKGNVELWEGDFLTHAATAPIYDAVVCMNVVYFWNDLETPFAKVFDLLKEQGSFHIFMVDKNVLATMQTPEAIFRRHAIDDVMATLTTAGFTWVDYQYERGYYITAKK